MFCVYYFSLQFNEVRVIIFLSEAYSYLHQMDEKTEIQNGHIATDSVVEHCPEMMTFHTRPTLTTTHILMGYVFTADQCSLRIFPMKLWDWQILGGLKCMSTKVGWEVG